MPPEDDSARPWYADGLRFECHGCGACCRGEGYVWVNRRAARRIAKTLQLTVEEFGRRYLRRIGRRHSLTEKPNHDCIFWNGGCSIYDVRPAQCRTFPFWRGILKSRQSWAQAAAGCGGIDTGRLYALGEIARMARGDGETEASRQTSNGPTACRRSADPNR